VGSAHNLSKRGWKCYIPTRFRRFSRGCKGVVYSSMTVNLLSLSAPEVDGFGVEFYFVRVFLYPEGATPDTIVLLGV
jgi:hypothetical protein